MGNIDQNQTKAKHNKTPTISMIHGMYLSKQDICLGDDYRIAYNDYKTLSKASYSPFY